MKKIIHTYIGFITTMHYEGAHYGYCDHVEHPLTVCLSAPPRLDAIDDVFFLTISASIALQLRNT